MIAPIIDFFLGSLEVKVFELPGLQFVTEEIEHSPSPVPPPYIAHFIGQNSETLDL